MLRHLGDRLAFALSLPNVWRDQLSSTEGAFLCGVMLWQLETGNLVAPLAAYARVFTPLLLSNP